MIFSVQSRRVPATLALLALSGLGHTQVKTPTPPLQGAEKSIVGNVVTKPSADTLKNFGDFVSSSMNGPTQVGSAAPRRFALTGGGTGAAGAPGDAAWHAWGGYAQNNVGYSFQPLQSSGTINVFMAGVDYTLSNKVIVGVALAGDRSRINLDYNGGRLDGSGVTVAPYIGIPLSRTWSLDATIGGGRTKLDTSARGVNGSFRDNRQMASVGVTYRAVSGNWQFAGRGAILSVSDGLGAYTLSNGVSVASSTVNLSQLRLGGLASYSFGKVVPYFGLSYVYDINRVDQVPLAGQTPANDRDAWTPVLGLRFVSGSSLYGGIQFSSEKRTQVKNDQLLLNLGVRF